VETKNAKEHKNGRELGGEPQENKATPSTWHLKGKKNELKKTDQATDTWAFKGVRKGDTVGP